MFFSAALLIATVAAQNAFNQILFPANNVVIQAGGGVQSLTWTNLTGGQVSVSLYSGTNPLRQVIPIATGIANTGTFLWTPETWLPAANDYVIGVRDLSGSAPTQYSPYFTVQLCSTCSASTRSTTSSFSAETVSVAGLVTRASFTEAFPTPAAQSASDSSATAAAAAAAGATGSAASGASGVVATASGAAGSAVSRASGAAASAASGVTSAAGSLASGASGVVGSAVSGARTATGSAAAATSRAAAVQESAAGLVLAAGFAAWLL
ncbi:hypothetical protein BCR37DRAFT_385148 [Protomyces lactucae-debilis]|uniref:Yeast cell wall synthesis Kre9/Knh1-like N-terminal domain-containing protein n=1 Tax=Protomyces lactucae-debilis TaxID=2754530 RepID=A0A1Y2FWH3_PROLT|nr:uncharacterized protein BCR37DRAFT_385148 [Protomyces lactucae-debilis]ORY87887.1 hypothetical protein BCR37DRAFT_385148 [Protomyces lactucae-debilis]